MRVPPGKAFSINKVRVHVHAEGSDTAGHCAVIEQQHPPQTGAPLHYHLHEAEGFYVLAGEYLFVIGSERYRVGPGEFVFAPKGVPHAFVNRSPDPARMLIMLMPAGAERYFELMSQIPQGDPTKEHRISALNERFGMVMVDPSGY